MTSECYAHEDGGTDQSISMSPPLLRIKEHLALRLRFSARLLSYEQQKGDSKIWVNSKVSFKGVCEFQLRIFVI